MSRYRTRSPRGAIVPATDLAPVTTTVPAIRRPALAPRPVAPPVAAFLAAFLAAMAIPAAGIATARPAAAQVTSPHVRTAATAFHAPHPGGGGGGGQIISGGQATGAQGRSGAGRSNQNFNGLQAPTFVIGRTQQVMTGVGGYAGQALVCGSRPAVCLAGQNMPTHFRS
ncbi:hypothetical protein GCM10023074_07360 [Microbispora amethystogenes]|uniref:Uncharacterized protein n=2 Tax=Microbispora amethystogenes TaxID=1427754 RepID=A0ABQ4FEF4_9ACTN|nr:hypothetical protein Mam01_33370 [Microbispora amethystogenes]